MRTRFVVASGLLFLVASSCERGRSNLAPTAPYIEVSPLGLDFGTVPLTQSKGLSLAISNLGQRPLTVESIAIDSTDFSGPTERLVVPPGDRTVIEISFSPMVEGVRTGQVQLKSDAENDSEFTVAVVGIGSSPTGCGDCNTPPMNSCASDTSLVVYEPTGTCGATGCQYQSNTVLCGGLCLADLRACSGSTGGGAGGGSSGSGGGTTGTGGGAAGTGGGATGGGVGTWRQTTYVKASNTGANDQFGLAMAISTDSNTVAISARDEDSAAVGINGNQLSEGLVDSGAVYIFVRSGTTWSQQAYLKASNPDVRDNFGKALALSSDGNTLAVGADEEDSAATGINGDQTNNNSNFAGAVYIFSRSGTTWSQQAYIKASNTDGAGALGDFFGQNVALSADGNTLAVGAPGESSNATGINGNQANDSVPRSGAVYVFVRSSSAWRQQAYIKASDAVTFDAFGVVALSGDGNTLAVGASQFWCSVSSCRAAADGPGKAYIFRRNVATWTQETILTAPHGDVGDLFGYRVALSTGGDTLVIASMKESSSATGVNGNQIDNSASESGAVYVWSRSGTTWRPTYLKASNTNATDIFGTDVAISGDGNVIVVGAQDEDSSATGINGNQADNSMDGAGAAYVFVRNGTSWVQESYVKPSNPGLTDYFGVRLALDATGRTMVIGSCLEKSNATGINGNQADNSTTNAGAAYIFEKR